ncbi:MAG: 5'/3'-nucleotidase SurE [Deferribacteres bacterium]|nr:5'/3'-nucleotidase SurE [candidate division KSB1 bacterium]MCB9504248.1 5'/3'-nucleotidase SurE [Deferribacteres bacterium]
MKPYVLLTNDDGIFAPGLYELSLAIKEIADVVIVAPDSERSAAGHAITIADPLRVFDFEKNGEFFGYAVNGTPADCVKIAYYAILDRKPDAVISGINLGSNTGINVIYSGTVSAATEGNVLGIPAFAVSLATYSNPNFKVAAQFARKLLPVVLEKKLPLGTCLNVNVPNVAEEKEIKGVKITRQGKSEYEDHYDKRTDPRNHVYYWLTGSKIDVEKEPEVDDVAITQNYISVTPLHYDLTNYNFLSDLRGWKL